MNKVQLKCLYKKLQEHAVLLSLLFFIISLSTALRLNNINSERARCAQELEESWRYAVSRIWNDENARPIRTLEGWGASFSRNNDLTINIQTSVHVKVIRHNSTQTSVIDAV